MLYPALRTWIMKVLGRSFFWVLFPVLPWAVQPVEHEEVAQRVIKLHRGRGATATQSRQWVRDSCRKLSGLLRQKNAVLNKLKNAIGAVEKDVGLSDEEKLFQVHTFEIFQKELNESENSVFQAIYGLQRALQGDYKDVVNMKESSRQRLEALREAAIKVSPREGEGERGRVGAHIRILERTHLELWEPMGREGVSAADASQVLSFIGNHI